MVANPYAFLRFAIAIALLTTTCAVVALLPISAAVADCGDASSGGTGGGVTSGASTLIIGVEQAVAGSPDCHHTPSGMEPVRDSDLDALCVNVAITRGENPFAFCDLPPNIAVPAAAITTGLVARAFRRLPLPASELTVQPPGGETLVNFPTNFYTEQGELTRTVRLLGQRVDLRIWPSEFAWRFGDGESLASQSAGAPYPHLLITHDYRSRGGVSPRVDTTYAAQFSVNGGPWHDVNGTVTIPGVPVRLEVRTASPVLVGYH